MEQIPFFSKMFADDHISNYMYLLVRSFIQLSIYYIIMLCIESTVICMPVEAVAVDELCRLHTLQYN